MSNLANQSSADEFDARFGPAVQQPGFAVQHARSTPLLRFQALPDFSEPLGVAGAFVGVHDDHLIVAGGANFPAPVWSHDKQWLDRIYVLDLNSNLPQWHSAGKLPFPIAYGASVSTPDGLFCLGGNDAAKVFDNSFFLRWDPLQQSVIVQSLGKLPMPLAYCQAVCLENQLLLVGGQQGATLDTATNKAWTCDWTTAHAQKTIEWRLVAACPGPPRAMHLLTAQKTPAGPVAILMSGRCMEDGQYRFLTDTWMYDPRDNLWQARQPTPHA